MDFQYKKSTRTSDLSFASASTKENSFHKIRTL